MDRFTRRSPCRARHQVGAPAAHPPVGPRGSVRLRPQDSFGPHPSFDLAVRAGDLWAVCDEPVPVMLDDRRELVPHGSPPQPKSTPAGLTSASRCCTSRFGKIEAPFRPFDLSVVILPARQSRYDLGGGPKRLRASGNCSSARSQLDDPISKRSSRSQLGDRVRTFILTVAARRPVFETSF